MVTHYVATSTSIIGQVQVVDHDHNWHGVVASLLGAMAFAAREECVSRPDWLAVSADLTSCYRSGLDWSQRVGGQVFELVRVEDEALLPLAA